MRLARFTTYGIGGHAEHFITVHNITELLEALDYVRSNSLRYFILGKGSNVLFDDRGFRGVVIHNRIEHFSQEGSTFTVGSGYSFALLGVKTARLGFTGLEFASTIPGSVGGAVVMNAGAHGTETQNALSKVHYIDEMGAECIQERAELEFSYRMSPFQGGDKVVVGAEFMLAKDETARDRQREFLSYRMSTQPLKERSCGCVFRNTEIASGRIIEECGLKGMKVGNVMVSNTHANFFVNLGKGTQENVLQLIEKVQEEVYNQRGIALHPEVQVISYE